jgi:hypothetical protein
MTSVKEPGIPIVEKRHANHHSWDHPISFAIKLSWLTKKKTKSYLGLSSNGRDSRLKLAMTRVDQTRGKQWFIDSHSVRHPRCFKRFWKGLCLTCCADRLWKQLVFDSHALSDGERWNELFPCCSRWTSFFQLLFTSSKEVYAAVLLPHQERQLPEKSASSRQLDPDIRGWDFFWLFDTGRSCLTLSVMELCGT